MSKAKDFLSEYFGCTVFNLNVKIYDVGLLCTSADSKISEVDGSPFITGEISVVGEVKQGGRELRSIVLQRATAYKAREQRTDYIRTDAEFSAFHGPDTHKLLSLILEDFYPKRA